MLLKEDKNQSTEDFHTAEPTAMVNLSLDASCESICNLSIFANWADSWNFWQDVKIALNTHQQV